jgi:hypothetical protein
MSNCSCNFPLPDPEGVITIIAAVEGRRPKPVVKSVDSKRFATP